MLLTARRSIIWSAGLAIFSMFFGAGNIVFPLALGQTTQDQTFFSILGMIITAVIVPLIGLLAMLLYNGDYASFFRKIGKVPGFIVTLLILGLIGPFGGIPRCITISFSTLSSFGVDPNSIWHLLGFSFLSCIIIFLFTMRPNKILSLLGIILTPILLLSLVVIIVKGSLMMPVKAAAGYTPLESFSEGFIGGYHTMDLLAAFFFSSVVLGCLKSSKEEIASRPLLKVAMYSSLVAAVLLACVYICFSNLAAGYSVLLGKVGSDQLLGTLAHELLGPYAGLIAGVAISFACLTTEIALTAVFAEFLRRSVFKEKVSHLLCLALTLGVSFLVSTLKFQGICAFLAPVLQICYPALIVLTLFNILNRLYGVKGAKVAFYTTLAISAGAYLI